MANHHPVPMPPKRKIVVSFLVGAALLAVAWLIFNREQPRHPRAQVFASSAENSPSLGGSRTQVSAAPPGSPALRPPSFPIDSPTSSHPVERVVGAGRVLNERLRRLANGTIQRTRLLKSDLMSPHLLRVEEEWLQDAAGMNLACLKRDLFLADQLILQVRPEVSRNALTAALANFGMAFDAFLSAGLCTVRLRETDLDAMPRALAALASRPDLFEHAEADGVGFGGAIPNDPDFSQQWGVHNTGQSGGVTNADVDGPELWSILGAAPGVVAILDSGLNFAHPDLQGLAWTNAAEIPGDGLDNDGNGRIDDVRGWDFTNGDNDPTDDHGHGSNVSGILAANRNNGVGVAGLVSGVKILVCKILDANNAGTTSALLAGTTYARQMGAPIMNMSLQNYPFSATLNTEFSACQTAGILLCICAGNQGVNNDVSPNYPSCYPHTNIIAVANHDRTDVRYSGTFNPSNYGPTNVDLFAPGREILGPILGSAYSFYTGTSQAAPFVTATAAAIKYLNPGWKAAQIRSSILNAVITRPAYSGLCTTGGRLNAFTSVAYAIRQQPDNNADGDPYSNLFEYLAGSRLDVSTNRPLVSYNLQGGLLRVRVPRVARPDAHLEIQRSTNLVNWSSAGVTNLSTTNLLEGGISAAAAHAGFLRIRALNTP